MEPKKRAAMMDNINKRFCELESFSLEFDPAPILQELVVKYNDMAQSDMNMQTHPDSVYNWESECDAINTLLDIIGDINVKTKVKVSFFTNSTISNCEKRKEFFDIISKMFQPIQTIVTDIEYMKTNLSDALDEVINNTEDIVMLQDSHENALEEYEELENLDWDVLEKYQDILDALDAVVNGAC